MKNGAVRWCSFAGDLGRFTRRACEGGRSDILAITMVRNTEHLAEFVHTRIGNIAGVRRTDSTLGVNFVKHDYRMARIVN